MTRMNALLLFGALLPGTALAGVQPAGTADGVEQALRALPIAQPATIRVDAAGLTGSGRRIWSIEPIGDPHPSRAAAGADRRP